MNEPHDDLEHVGAAIRAAAQQVSAPAGLRARVVAQRSARRRSPAPSRPCWSVRPLLAGASLAGAALTVALVLVLGGGATGAPTVVEAATVALGQPTAPAPPVDPRRPGLLVAGVDGVRFPAWKARGWRASGQRRVRLDGRPATAVFYEAGGRRVGYLILSGRPLPVPGAARQLQRFGVRFAVLRAGRGTVVTWRRAGHTCVLAGRELSASQLIEMAAAPAHGYSRR